MSLNAVSCGSSSYTSIPSTVWHTLHSKKKRKKQHILNIPTAQSQPTPENCAHVAREISAARSSSEVLGRVQAVRVDHKVAVGHVAVGGQRRVKNNIVTINNDATLQLQHGGSVIVMDMNIDSTREIAKKMMIARHQLTTATPCKVRNRQHKRTHTFPATLTLTCRQRTLAARGVQSHAPRCSQTTPSG